MMQIQLKQNEIEAALKLFVSQQGINLANKTIQMEFTAGRKESGISVEMTIEEVYSVSTNGAAGAASSTTVNASPTVAVNTVPTRRSEDGAPDGGEAVVVPTGVKSSLFAST